MSYQSGAYTPASWRLDGAVADTTLKMLKSEFSEEGIELVKKLAGNGALPERYAGFGDAVFTVNLLVDGASLPSNSAGLGFRFGNKGTIRWAVKHTGTSPSSWAHCHVMIRKVNYVNNVDDLLEYSIDIALDASAVAQGQASSFVYPS